MADVLVTKIVKQHKQIQMLIEENKKLQGTIEILKRECAELHLQLSTEANLAVVPPTQ